MTDTDFSEARTIIAGFFKKRREELGMSETELADLMRLSVRTIQKFEDGRYCPPYRTYLELCEILNMAPAATPFKGEKELIEEIRENFKT